MIRLSIMLLALSAGLMMLPPAMAQSATNNRSDAPADSGDIEKLLCKDVMILSGLDRDVTIAFMHGYVLGKSDGSTVNSAKLTDATESFLNICVEQPKKMALEVLAELVAR